LDLCNDKKIGKIIPISEEKDMSELKPSFTTVAFRTANKAMSSMCHAGLVHYKEGQESAVFESFVNQMKTEKITNKNYSFDKLAGSPMFREFTPVLEKEMTKGDVIVTFGVKNNMRILKETLQSLKPYDFFFIDVEDLFKVAFKGKVKKITLENVAEHFGMTVDMENPVSEAKVIGEILLKMYNEDRVFQRDIRNKIKLQRFVEFAR
jgi:hypothetical protein